MKRFLLSGSCLILFLLIAAGYYQPVKADTSLDNYTIYRSGYQVVIKENRAEVELSFKAIIHTDKWTEINLVPLRVPLIFKKLPSRVIASQDNRSRKLLFKKKGTYEIKGQMVIDIAAAEKIKKISLPILPSTFSRMEVMIPETDLGVIVFPQSVWRQKSLKRKTVLTIVPPSTDELIISWGPKKLMARPAPSVSLHTVSAIQIEKGLRTISADLKFTVSQHPLKSFDVKLPAGVTLLQVNGRNVDRWFIRENGPARILRVYLESPVVQGTARFNLRLEQSQADSVQALTLTPVEVLDCPTQSGTIQVLTSSGLTLNVLRVEHLEQTNAPTYRNKNVIAYKYVRLPARLTVQTKPKKPALIVRSELVHTIKSQLVMTQGKFLVTIRERGLDAIKLKIPVDSSVLSVTGQNIKDYRVQGTRLQINFKKRLLGRSEFYLELERNIPKDAPVLFTNITSEEVLQSETFMAVKVDNVEVQPGRLTRMSQINVGQLSPWLKARVPVMAFQSTQKNWQAVIIVSPLKPIIDGVVYEQIETLEDRFIYQTRIKLIVQKTPIFNLNVQLPAGVTPLEVSSGLTKEWSFDPANRNLKVTFQRGVKGEHLLQLRAERKISLADQIYTLAPLQIPVLRKSQYWLVCAASDEIVLEPDAIRGITEESINKLPSPLNRRSKLKLAFHGLDQKWQIRLKVKVAPAHLLAKVYVGVIIREGQARVINQIDYTIKNRSVNLFRLKLPAEAVNVEITGRDIKHIDTQPADQRLVRLGSRIKGRYTLTVSYEQPLDKLTELAFTPLQLVDTELASGIIVSVPNDPRSEISLLESKHVTNQALAETDSLLPASFLKKLPAQPVYVLSYGHQEPFVRLSIKTHQLGSLLLARVTSADLFSITRPNGEMVTYLNMTIENSGKQHLSLRPPGGTVFWGAYVDDKPVKAIQKKGNEILVPLLPEKGPIKKENSVVIVYLQDLSKMGLSKKFALTMPGTDLKIENATWHMFLPQGYYIGEQSGNMAMVYQNPNITYPSLVSLIKIHLSSFLSKVWNFIPPIFKKAVLVIFGLILLMVLLWLFWKFINMVFKALAWQFRPIPRLAGYVAMAMIIVGGVIALSATVLVGRKDVSSFEVIRMNMPISSTSAPSPGVQGDDLNAFDESLSEDRIHLDESDHRKLKSQLEMELPRDIVSNRELDSIFSGEKDEKGLIFKQAEMREYNERADNEDFQEAKDINPSLRELNQLSNKAYELQLVREDSRRIQGKNISRKYSQERYKNGDSLDFMSDKPLKGAGIYDSIGAGGGAGGPRGGPRGNRNDLSDVGNAKAPQSNLKLTPPPPPPPPPPAPTSESTITPQSDPYDFDINGKIKIGSEAWVDPVYWDDKSKNEREGGKYKPGKASILTKVTAAHSVVLNAPRPAAIFTRTSMGRTSGALPLSVSLPLDRTNYYAFESRYLGEDAGRINFRCFSSNLVLFFQLLACLVLAGLVFAGSRKNLHATIIGGAVGTLILIVGQISATGLFQQILLSGGFFLFVITGLLILFYQKLKVVS